MVTASTNDTITPLPSGQPSLIRAVRSGLALLSPREARQAVGLSLAIAVASALEIAAVTAALPFVNVVIQPTAVHGPGLLAELHRRAGSPPAGQFIELLGFIVIVLTVLAAAGSIEPRRRPAAPRPSAQRARFAATEPGPRSRP